MLNEEWDCLGSNWKEPIPRNPSPPFKWSYSTCRLHPSSSLASSPDLILAQVACSVFDQSCHPQDYPALSSSPLFFSWSSQLWSSQDKRQLIWYPSAWSNTGRGPEPLYALCSSLRRDVSFIVLISWTPYNFLCSQRYDSKHKHSKENRKQECHGSVSGKYFRKWGFLGSPFHLVISSSLQLGPSWSLILLRAVYVLVFWKVKISLSENIYGGRG